MLTGWRGKGENNGFSKMGIIRGLVKTSFCAVIEKKCPVGKYPSG